MALDNAFPTAASALTTMAQWESLFRGMSGNGVIAGFRSEFAPSLNSGARTAVMASGAAQIRGFHTDGTTSTSTAIPAASGQNRVDRLALRLNRASGTAAGWITPAVITGTPSASPQPPALNQSDAGLFDIPIARWTSTSAGALSNLVDERVFVGGDPIAFRSNARPAATIRRMGFEIDTGKGLVADGTSWVEVFQDTGKIALSMNGPAGGAWTPNKACEAHLRNGVVTVRIAVKRWSSSGLVTSDSDGSVPIIVPEVFRPDIIQFGFGFHDRAPVWMQVEPDGSVRLIPLSVDLPAGRTVNAAATYVL